MDGVPPPEVHVVTQPALQFPDRPVRRGGHRIVACFGFLCPNVVAPHHVPTIERVHQKAGDETELLRVISDRRRWKIVACDHGREAQKPSFENGRCATRSSGVSVPLSQDLDGLLVRCTRGVCVTKQDRCQRFRVQRHRVTLDPSEVIRRQCGASSQQRGNSHRPIRLGPVGAERVGISTSDGAIVGRDDEVLRGIDAVGESVEWNPADLARARSPGRTSRPGWSPQNVRYRVDISHDVDRRGQAANG